MSEIMTKDRIKRVTKLAALSLDAEEERLFQQDVSRMLEYVDCMNALDTEGVEPLYYVIDGKSPLRDDYVESDYERDELLQGAANRNGEYLVVPKSI